MREHESLTPAQRAALADRPVRVPLLAAAMRPPPLLLPGSTAGSSAGGAAGGSTLRETTRERWAEAHRPTTPHLSLIIITELLIIIRWAEAHRPTTPHTTREWHTAGAASRVWTQHYCLETGMPHCVFCCGLHTPQPDSPFCSEACAASCGGGHLHPLVTGRGPSLYLPCTFPVPSLWRRALAPGGHGARLRSGKVQGRFRALAPGGHGARLRSLTLRRGLDTTLPSP